MTDHLPPADDCLISVVRVGEIIGLSKAMIYRMVRQQRFPKPAKVGGAASRWSEREVRAWRDERLAARAA